MKRNGKEINNCCDCDHHDTYFPTDDWFDEEFICVCKLTDRKPPQNECGYGRCSKDFPIPDWCPLQECDPKDQAAN